MSRFILRKAQLINRGSSMAKPSGENIQNNMENNMTEYSSGDNKKTVLITVVAGIVVLAALIWWMRQAPVSQQVEVTPTPDAEAASINQDVDSIDVGDLNAEFNAIDADLQGL